MSQAEKTGLMAKRQKDTDNGTGYKARKSLKERTAAVTAREAAATAAERRLETIEEEPEDAAPTAKDLAKAKSAGVQFGRGAHKK